MMAVLCALTLAAVMDVRGGENAMSRAQADSAESWHRLVAPGLRSDGVPPPNPTPDPARSTAGCVVTRIVDGDTIDVAGCTDEGRIRFILADTPEVFFGVQCYGREASAYTTAWLLGKTVTLERDVSDRDRFDRKLRYIWIDGVLFNEQIVRDGYAVLATFPPDIKYVDEIREAQRFAFEREIGLWGACGDE
jgi:micrococcal nuclease